MYFISQIFCSAMHCDKTNSRQYHQENWERPSRQVYKKRHHKSLEHIKCIVHIDISFRDHIPWRQPTCELIHRVERFPFHGIITVSTSRPSLNFNSNLVVSSLARDTNDSVANPPSTFVTLGFVWPPYESWYSFLSFLNVSALNRCVLRCDGSWLTIVS